MKITAGSPGLQIGETDNRYFRLTAENTATKYQVLNADGAAGWAWPSVSVGHTWNNASDTWTAFKVNVTDSASATASKLADFAVAGVSKCAVLKSGVLRLGSDASGPSLIPSAGLMGFNRRDTSETNAGIAIGYYAKWAVTIVSGGLFGFSSSATNTLGGNHTPDTAIGRSSSGVVEVNSGTLGTLADFKCRRVALTQYLDVVEMTAPAAPAANTCRIYVEDTGTGKTRLMALFPTGAAQQIAIEP